MKYNEVFTETPLRIYKPDGGYINLNTFNCIRVIDRVVSCDAHDIKYASHTNALIAWSQLVKDIRAGKEDVYMMDDKQCSDKFIQMNKRGVINV